MSLRSERRFISYTDIKSGMLLQFQYKKKFSDFNTESYTVVVIDPRKQNEHATEPQLHALLIDDLSDSQLIDMIRQVGKFMYDEENRRMPITYLQTDEAYSKYLSSIRKDRRYRTFNTANMFGIRQILTGKIS